MLNVPLLYGPKGFETGGDEYAAEILRRTVDGQPSAAAAFDHRVRQLRAGGSLVAGDLSTLILAHTEWVSLMLWQMATCYLDACLSGPNASDVDFATHVYPNGDALCDAAAQWSRAAVKASSEITHGGKTRPSRECVLPSFKVRNQTLFGVWAVYDLVTNQVDGDVAFFAREGNIPLRLRNLYRNISKEVRLHVSVMRELRKDFATTMIAQNKIDILNEARSHVETLFSLGQQQWAPFLLGGRYTEALRRPLALDELELGFDPWVLTDPLKKRDQQGNSDCQAELAAFWSSVKDPQSLNRLALDIATLRRNDSIRRRTGRGYSIVPWPSQFMVRKSFTLCGRQFEPGDLIAYFARTRGDITEVDVRKTGKLTKPLHLLGHPSAE